MRIVKILIAILLLGGTAALIANTLAENKKQLQEKVQQKVTFDAVMVKVADVSKEKLNTRLSLVGTVVADRDVLIASETAGRVLEMYVDKGSYVKVGTPIAYVDDELKKANLMTAEAALEKAKKEVERFEALAKAKVGTEQNLENVRLQLKNAEAALIVAQRQVKDSKIISSANGVVSDRMVETGEMLAPGAPVINVVDINSLRLRVNVPEADVFKLQVGETVEITADVYPTQKFSGRIVYIGVKGDAMHTFPVEIALPSSGFKAGMYARATFSSAPSAEAVTIPRKALLGGAKNPEVYVVSGGRALLRKIVVGSTLDDKVEVLQGLEAGEQIVIDGQVNLSDNTKVKVQL